MYHRMILVVRGSASDLVHVSYMYIMYLIQDLHISFHFFSLKVFDIGDKSMSQLFLVRNC